jgi:hypothetical protein
MNLSLLSLLNTHEMIYQKCQSRGVFCVWLLYEEGKEIGLSLLSLLNTHASM